MRYLVKKIFSDSYSTEKISFVIINILVSSLAFFKSFVFMKFLGLYDLGILTIIQTVMLSIGLLQFGFLNGGYRIFSLGINRETVLVNNQVFSFIAVLSFILIIICLCLLPVNFGFSSILIFVGVGIGILSLISNWLSNTLIAEQLFKKLNKFNLVSTIFSLLALPLALYLKVYGAVIVLFVQPVVFILFCLYQQRELRPTKFIIDKVLILNILKYGFIPFLTGIFTLLTTQIERWSILGWLGTINLGKFYLVFLFSSLYVLVPGSLNNLFFPNTMKLYQNHDFKSIRQIIFRYYSILIGYNIMASVLTVLFLNQIILWLLPVHAEGVKYVFWILPGLIIVSLSEPIGLLYNASVILKPMFWAYFSSVLLFILLVLCVNMWNELSLGWFAIVRSITGIYIFTFFILSYLKFRKKIWSNRI